MLHYLDYGLFLAGQIIRKYKNNQMLLPKKYNINDLVFGRNVTPITSSFTSLRDTRLFKLARKMPCFPCLEWSTKIFVVRF